MKKSFWLILALLTGCVSQKAFRAEKDFFLDENFRRKYIQEKPDLPEGVKAAVLRAEIWPGMSQTIVEELLGPPEKKYVSETDWLEVWFYSVGFNHKKEVVSVIEEPLLQRQPSSLDKEIKRRRQEEMQQRKKEIANVLAGRVWSLAFVVDSPEEPGQVWVIDSEGKGLKKVGSQAEHISWVFGESTLAALILKKKEDGTSQERFALWDISKSEEKEIPLEVEGGFFSWASGQKWLAIHPGNSRQIVFVDREGTQKGSKILPGKLNQPVRWPVFSPDGSAVAFYEGAGPAAKLVVMETIGDRVSVVLEPAEPAPVVWSPDSRRLVATLFLEKSTVDKIRMPKEGETTEGLEKNARRLLEKWRRLKRELVVLDTYTGEITKTGIRGLAGQINYTQNAWAPDGDYLVVTTALGKKESVCRVEASGRWKVIAQFEQNVSCQEAALRPDSQAVVFVLNGQAIWSVTPEGKDRKLLATVKEGIIRELTWSPWPGAPVSSGN
ncbi:MAG: hypothetical protein NC911_07035 [Candidatus Omnitrophica bacterium]|nr:hypothetical protein [Candidatus Omnitrophota bacterium]